MTHGENIDTLISVYEQTGFMPPTLASKPELLFYIDDFYQAFLLLYKQKENSDTPIRIADIAGFSQLFPDLNDNELLVKIVTFADKTCLDFRKEQQENGRDNKDGNATHDNRPDTS